MDLVRTSDIRKLPNWHPRLFDGDLILFTDDDSLIALGWSDLQFRNLLGAIIKQRGYSQKPTFVIVEAPSDKTLIKIFHIDDHINIGING